MGQEGVPAKLITYGEAERQGLLVDLRDRMLEYTQRGGPDDCWHWIGMRDKDGYAVLQFGDRPHGAHRIAFFLEHQRWPGYCTRVCRSDTCVNPAHLYEGTQVRLGRPRRLTRLTPEDVERIRYGQEDPRVLMAEYGCIKRTIENIRNNRTWVGGKQDGKERAPKKRRGDTPGPTETHGEHGAGT